MVGLSFGKSSNKSSQSASTFIDPDQQVFNQDINNRARMLADQGVPESQIANLNNNQNIAAGNQFGLGGQQLGAGQNIMNQGLGLMGGSNNALGFANNALASNQTAYGIGAGVTGGLSAAGNTATANAANNRGFNQNNLSKYINNDLLNSQIDAATRDVGRVLNEQTLTGIGSAAAGTGNSGSSRAGMMEGVAVRGAQDRAGDISAGLRGQAYNNAINVEAQRAAQNAGFNQQSNMFNAGQTNQMFAGGMNLGMNAFNQNLRNQQFAGSLANQIGMGGVKNVMAGGDVAGAGIDNQFGSGNFMFDYNQSLLDNNRSNQMNPFSGLEFYNEMVGDPTVLSKSKGSSKGKSFNMGLDLGS